MPLHVTAISSFIHLRSFTEHPLCWALGTEGGNSLMPAVPGAWSHREKPLKRRQPALLLPSALCSAAFTEEAELLDDGQ